MMIVHVHAQVKAESVEAFKQATMANARESVREPGIADRLSRQAAALYQLSRNKFYLDEIYQAFFVGPVTAVAHVLRVFDQYILDGLVDLIGQLPAMIGSVLRTAQNGLVQYYGLLIALGVAGLVVVVLRR